WLGGAALDIQGQWLSLLPITLASGFAAIGVALLIAALASSAVQATTIGGATNLLLGAISGVMVPRAVMPDALELLGLISPMAWALDGYWDIILRQSPMTATLPECGALLL
ncbi:MAG: ABC transporter permease, partial [Oceanococcaceae bacterium]